MFMAPGNVLVTLSSVVTIVVARVYRFKHCALSPSSPAAVLGSRWHQAAVQAKQAVTAAELREKEAAAAAQAAASASFAAETKAEELTGVVKQLQV